MIFIAFWIVLNFAFSYEIKLWDALDRLQTNIKRNIETNQINGKAVVDDIYKKSLSIVEDSNSAPMMSAINKTVQDLNNSKEDPCQLDSQDIVNIMYFANSSFQRDLKSSLVSFEKPSRNDMGKSCNKLNICIYKPEWWTLNNTPTLNQACQSRVEKEYITFYVNSYYMETIWWWNKWSNYFWNFSLDDSSYDIMNDVYGLAKILFQDINQPVQTLFYKMPSVDYTSLYEEPEMNMDIDWFSPYNNYTTTNNYTGSIWSLSIVSEVQVEDTKLSSLNSIDEDIKNFVESVNFDISNPSTVIWGNQCFSWFEYQSTWSTSSVSSENLLTPGEYLSGVLEDIEQVSCNNDGICQSWETTTCFDCINEWGNPDFEEIQSMLTNAAEQSTGQIDADDPVLGCFQKCEWLACNATNCDKLVCYAKCACQTYDSPVFDPTTNPGLTSVFKIKFCIMPVMENKITRNKTVHNIASIFSEIYGVLQNLRNSGQLSINVKTKEFLDTSKKNNKFGEQLSFSMNSTTKAVVSNESELTKTEKQIEFNTSLMEAILWFSKDPGLENEKNKYIVMDDPCEYKVKKQIAENPNQRARLLANCQNEMKMDVSIQDFNIESALQDQQVVLLSSEFDTFLMKNRDFWYEAFSMLKSFSDAAKALSEK